MRERGHIDSSTYKGRTDGWWYSVLHWTRLKGNGEVNVNMLGRS